MIEVLIGMALVLAGMAIGLAIKPIKIIVETQKSGTDNAVVEAGAGDAFVPDENVPGRIIVIKTPESDK